MISVNARIVVHLDKVEEFETLAAELWEVSHRSEPGLHRYEYLRGTDPGTYLTSMIFADYEAFLFHQASPHHVSYGEQMRPLMASLDVEYAQPVDGTFGRPDVDVAPSDVDPGKVEYYRERYPEPSSQWWD